MSVKEKIEEMLSDEYMICKKAHINSTFHGELIEVKRKKWIWKECCWVLFTESIHDDHDVLHVIDECTPPGSAVIVVESVANGSFSDPKELFWANMKDRRIVHVIQLCGQHVQYDPDFYYAGDAVVKEILRKIKFIATTAGNQVEG